jgi:hypothetical protein
MINNTRIKSTSIQPLGLLALVAAMFLVGCAGTGTTTTTTTQTDRTKSSMYAR